MPGLPVGVMILSTDARDDTDDREESELQAEHSVVPFVMVDVVVGGRCWTTGEGEVMRGLCRVRLGSPKW